jgi:hypothetical protein
MAATMQRISINDIKRNYPDEWILLGNPEIDEKKQEILSGIILFHSPDKKEAVYLGKPMTAGYDKTALFFNRVAPRRKRNVIASLFYSINQ